MNELNFEKIRKTFILNRGKVEKEVVLSTFTAYNRDGKETIEVTNMDSENCTMLFDYDEFGNLIHRHGSTGVEYWYKYDEFNNVIYFRTNQGDEVRFEYDGSGNCIRSKSSRGFESRYRYNSKNQKVFEYHSRFGDVSLFQYDKDNKLIRSLDSNGNVTKYNYDNEGNLILKLSSYGNIEYYEYDQKGNLLYYAEAHLEDYDIDVENYVLDLDSLDDKEELFYEYEFYSNGKIKKQFIYQEE